MPSSTGCSWTRIHGRPRRSSSRTRRRRGAGSAPTARRATTSSAGPPACRPATVWYSSTSFTVDVDLGDGQTHDLELYFLDWYGQGRSEQVQISNAATGTVLGTEKIASFSGGVYLDWQVSGDLVITITNEGGINAVLNGVFFDPTTSGTALVGGQSALQANSRATPLIDGRSTSGLQDGTGRLIDGTASGDTVAILARGGASIEATGAGTAGGLAGGILAIVDALFERDALADVTTAVGGRRVRSLASA
jgi:hypothetical protein